MFGATAIGALLRFTAAGEWSLWIDEAHTWRDATMPWGALESGRKLYALPFLLLRALLAREWIAGDEFSLRLPFIAVGILTVPLVALCGRRIVGAWPAVLSAFFCALNPWHVYWSQNARGYVLVVAFAVLAVRTGVAYAERLRLRDFFATMGLILAGALCHPTGAMQALGFVVFLLLRQFRSLRGRTIVRIAVAAGAAGLALPLVVQALPFEKFLSSKNDPSLLHLIQTTAFYYVPLVLLLAAVGLALMARELGRDRALLLGCVWVVPILLLTEVSCGIAKVTARYAICTLPAITWLAAFACARVGAAMLRSDAPRLVRVSGAAILPLFVAIEYGAGTWDYFATRHGDRAQWREACAFVRERAGSGALRVLTVAQPQALYYLRPLHWSAGTENPYPSIQVVSLLDWMVQKGQDEDERQVCQPGVKNHFKWHLAEAEKTHASFFVMVSLPELAEKDGGGGDDPPGAIRRELEREFDLVLHLPCWVGPKDESVYVFAPRVR